LWPTLRYLRLFNLFQSSETLLKNGTNLDSLVAHIFPNRHHNLFTIFFFFFAHGKDSGTGSSLYTTLKPCYHHNPDMNGGRVVESKLSNDACPPMKGLPDPSVLSRQLVLCPSPFSLSTFTWADCDLFFFFFCNFITWLIV
jgi:hypothetical protein